MEPCDSNDRIFTGYIVGEIGMLYRNAFTENLTTEVNLQLQAGNCDVVTTAFQHATKKQSAGDSSFQALGGVLTELKQLPAD